MDIFIGIFTATWLFFMIWAVYSLYQSLSCLHRMNKVIDEAEVRHQELQIKLDKLEKRIRETK